MDKHHIQLEHFLLTVAGWSQIAYTYQDSFTVAQTVVDHGDPITATQLKAGAYDLSEDLSLFANFGLVKTTNLR